VRSRTMIELEQRRVQRMAAELGDDRGERPRLLLVRQIAEQRKPRSAAYNRIWWGAAELAAESALAPRRGAAR